MCGIDINKISTRTNPIKESDSFKKYWLYNIEGLGLKKINILLDKYGSYSQIYDAFREKNIIREIPNKLCELMSNEKLRNKIYENYKKLKEEDIKFIAQDDILYPEKLANIHNKPKALYCFGNMPNPKNISIGIVGARNCSYYGRDIAQMFSYRLAKAGINIISGMARGIDGISHKGALEACGKTYAILGCGVDVCYPIEHINLYNNIKKNGGIISEFPLTTKAKPNYFPLRNRIISALSDGLLVIEAKKRSGSLITVDRALEQGKDVFVIPGRIGDELSEGCNRLILQGAIPVLTPNDILEYYNVDINNKKEMDNKDIEKIYNLLDDNPKHIDEIFKVSEFDEFKTRKMLMELEQEKLIRQLSRDYFVRK